MSAIDNNFKTKFTLQGILNVYTPLTANKKKKIIWLISIIIVEIDVKNYNEIEFGMNNVF